MSSKVAQQTNAAVSFGHSASLRNASKQGSGAATKAVGNMQN